MFKTQQVKKKLPALVAQNAQIIDVRTSGEFNHDHYPNSINIPLEQFYDQMDTIKKDKPVILVCRSGTRSGMAGSLLRRNGFKTVVNAGKWQNLKHSEVQPAV